ncbi:MAG: UDP-galactopyranose mutase [Streptococcaceae bacterium]|jgi:UDP-galactopyranose mutase|nr:UDP-galactopyranose mutase [Streptococcaceae bacterium]
MDALVVGCGLSGSVIARYLAEELGKKVVIWEKRDHIAGNMYDFKDKHGILVHKYGPHTFHTKKKELYDYMCRFTEWQNYKLTCGAMINGKYTPTPFNFQTIDDFYSQEEAEDLKTRLKLEFSNRKTITVLEALDAKDPMIKQYAQFLFDNDYSLYTAKQWGVSPEEIDPSVLKRVPLRLSYENRYFDDEYQVMPKKSYVHFFKNLSNHPNIEVQFGVDALEHIKIKDNTLYLDGEEMSIPVIYTGAIDELFELEFGSLPYRSLKFEWKHELIESKQEAPVVAYPQEKDFTRITEYKKLPVQEVKGTSYAVEYPLKYEIGNKSEPYYPVLTQNSQLIYRKYLEKSKKISNLYLCGRLADFKYYNMDQVLERALYICKTISAFLYLEPK